MLSGLAMPAEWKTEDSHSPWEDKFFLEWSTLSKSPVELVLLQNVGLLDSLEDNAYSFQQLFIDD